MPLEFRELGRGPDGDLWRLVFDRPRGTLHVERTGGPEPAPAPGQPIQPTRSLSLGAVFDTAPPTIAAELTRILAPVFPDPKPGG